MSIVAGTISSLHPIHGQYNITSGTNEFDRNIAGRPSVELSRIGIGLEWIGMELECSAARPGIVSCPARFLAVFDGRTRGRRRASLFSMIHALIADESDKAQITPSPP